MESTSFHQKGINLRHLGLLYGACTSENSKKMMMTAAVSRVAKSDLRMILRHRMKSVQVPSDERKCHFDIRMSWWHLTAFKWIVVKYLNQLSGFSKQSITYWRKEMCRKLKEWFQFPLDANFIRNFVLSDHADISLILIFLFNASGIEVIWRSTTL